MQNLAEFLRRAALKLITRNRVAPLLQPLGRTRDSVIDDALGTCGMTRTKLFTPGSAMVPHRERIAAMIPMQGLDPETLTRNFWATLKEAEHRCAYCENARRCERWLKWGRSNDAPRIFCPNATTFEKIRREASN